MCFGGILGPTKTVKVNGKTVYSNKYRNCCRNMYTMNSCFGLGYGWNYCMPFSPEAFLGFAAGAAVVPFLPAIFKGIGKAASAVGKGISNLWKNIFHKKSKTKADAAES